MSRSRWEQLRARALALPRAIEDFPWGVSVLKIDYPQRRGADGFAVGPMFMWLGRPEDASASLKLSDSHEEAIGVCRAVPTAMSGLGRWGWLTISLDEVEFDLLDDWLEESYRNVAPRAVMAEFDAYRSKH